MLDTNSDFPLSIPDGFGDKEKNEKSDGRKQAAAKKQDNVIKTGDGMNKQVEAVEEGGAECCNNPRL